MRLAWKRAFFDGYGAPASERNFVGIEMYDSVLLRALQKREELEEAGEEFSNLVFIRVDARLLPEIFEKDEVDGII